VEEEKVYFSDDYLNLIKSEFNTNRTEETNEPKKRNYERERKFKKIIDKKPKNIDRKESNSIYDKKGKYKENGKFKNNKKEQTINEVKPKTDNVEVIQTVVGIPEKKFNKYNNNNYYDAAYYEEYGTGYKKNGKVVGNGYNNNGYNKSYNNGLNENGKNKYKKNY
jgi:hypothetical protein